MNTTRNRSTVLAGFLRTAVADLRRSESIECKNPCELFASTLVSIESVAEELEAVARGAVAEVGGVK